MHYVLFVQILNSINDLLKESTSLSFSNSTLGYNVIKQFTATSVFHDQVELFLGFDYFIELDNILVPDHFENMYFSCHSFYISHIRNSIFLQNFHCYFLTC